MAVKTASDPAAQQEQVATGESDSLIAPPPTYAQVVTASSASTPRAPSHPTGPSSLPPSHLYHPIHHSQPSAEESAQRRARSRFLGALFWGMMIWLTVGLITGGVVVDATERGREQRRGRHGRGH